ncbi:MAG: hypothetical protein K2X80_11720, partial [Pseudomonadaceae bacterium]|nr:hypothetical protein [Pseudomonadaceae bacterium]
MDCSTNTLDEALAAVKLGIQQHKLAAAFAALDTLRVRFPASFEVALRWCRLACALNRLAGLPAYALPIYRQRTCHFERAQLANLVAYALFLQQQFDLAWSWRQRSLGHLVMLAQQGQRPAAQA